MNLAHLSTISTNATSGLLSKTQGALARAIEAYSDDELVGLYLVREVEAGGPGSGWTTENGHVSNLTPQSKGERLQKLGYGSKTFTGDREVWRHKDGTEVHVSKYNAPNQPNLRKFEVYTPKGDKLFNGHQFNKVEDIVSKPGVKFKNTDDVTVFKKTEGNDGKPTKLLQVKDGGNIDTSKLSKSIFKDGDGMTRFILDPENETMVFGNTGMYNIDHGNMLPDVAGDRGSWDTDFPRGIINFADKEILFYDMSDEAKSIAEQWEMHPKQAETRIKNNQDYAERFKVTVDGKPLKIEWEPIAKILGGRAEVSVYAEVATLLGYSDDEERDSSGKWTSGDDGRAQSVLKPQVEYEQVVKNYMQDIRDGKDVGAVLVSDKDHSHIVDGNHKTEAYLRLGKQPPRVYAVDRLKTLIQMGQENKTADEVADSIGERLKSEDIKAYSEDEERDSSGKWTSGDDAGFFKRRDAWQATLSKPKVLGVYTNAKIGLPLAKGTQGHFTLAVHGGVDVPIGKMRQGTMFVTDNKTGEVRRAGYWMDWPEDHSVAGFEKYSAMPRADRAMLEVEEQKKYGYESAFDHGSTVIQPTVKAYSDDEERDDHGKWTSGGSLKPAEEDRTQWPQHIQDLKVPPAWKDVHYSEDPTAALLAVGKDAKGRDQRVYSKDFQDSQAALKFERVEELGKQLPLIDQQLSADRKSDDDKTREHADAALLVRAMGVRPGSETDTKAKVQAYGATTLEGRHVRVSTTGNVRLNFTGKKGVGINLPVEDKQVAAMLVSRKADAGNSGQIFPHVSNSSLLDYVHDNLDHGGFKSKDFRTYLGTSTAQGLVSSMKEPATPKDYVKAVRSVASAVAEKLGNTPAVALSSYIAPQVFSGWKMHAGVTAEAMELPQVYYGEVSDNQRDFRDVAGLFDSSDTDDGDDSDGSVEKMLGFDPAKMGIAASVLRRSTAKEWTQKKLLFVQRECATLLAEFDEEQHPRDEHGKFTDGGGETTTDRTSWHFDDFHPEDKINGIPLAHMSHPDFEKYTNPDLKETPLKVGPGQHAAAGVIMIEPGNKVWIVTPDKYFGGYRNTFPKGTQESGEALQTTAVRETYEESGLVGKITGVLGDVDRTTSSTRYYIGERVGGSPAMAGEETYAVKLLDLNDPKTDERLQDVMGKTTKDADVLSMIREHLGIEQPAQPEAPATGKMTAADIMDKKIGGAQGSNVGGFYKGTDGVDRYVKLYNNPEQAHGEVLANTIYRDLNINAPQSQVFSLPNGKEAFASDIVHGGKTLEQTGVTKENAREVLKGFAADVLTANWDVVGLTYDNILMKGGEAHRLDNGSAFLYRAQGTAKPAALLNQTTELKSFFTVNKEFASMAKKAGVTSADEVPGFRSQVKAIAELQKVAGGWDKYLDAKAPYLSVGERSKIGSMLTSRTEGLKVAAGVGDSSALHDKIKSLFSEAEDLAVREAVACSR